MKLSYNMIPLCISLAGTLPRTPTHPDPNQSPEPELILSSPDPVHEPEDTSTHPGTQADDPILEIADEPEEA